MNFCFWAINFWCLYLLLMKWKAIGLMFEIEPKTTMIQICRVNNRYCAIENSCSALKTCYNWTKWNVRLIYLYQKCMRETVYLDSIYASILASQPANKHEYWVYVKITTLSEDIAILSKHLTKIACTWFALFCYI